MIYLNSSNLKDAKFLLYTHNIHTKNGYNISTNVVKFKDHIKWYRKKLKSKNSKIYIGYKNKAKFGYVRFDRIKNRVKNNISEKLENRFWTDDINDKFEKILKNKSSSELNIDWIVRQLLIDK